ncbi:dTDP-glucose 4,6-dehydratase, partial [Candidatus Woesearchaeota archaeon]
TYAGNIENLKQIENHPNYKFVQGDICDTKLVNQLVKRVDAVVHFAAESHVDRSILKSDVFIRTNVLGTHILLEAARINGNKRFHHISTDEVFGSLGKEGKFNEKTPYNPRSPYSASKAASDHLARAYFHTYNLPVTITNCSNNYGPYQFPEKLIPLFITNLLEGKKLPLYGDGLNVRDWLHVEDHCEAIDLVLHEGKLGETYCVGGNAEKTNLEITWLILSAFGKGEDFIQFVEDRKGHDRRYAIDSTKIQEELGWRPKHTFEQGMRETIQWYKDNQEWWKKLKDRKFEEFEIKKYKK